MIPKRVFFFGFWLVGCQKTEKQPEMEARAGREIERLLGLYEALGNPRPTNLAQVYLTLKMSYPHEWHQNFRELGWRAGFSNSFYEKYVFLPGGVTNRLIVGEIIMMNAHPYEGIGQSKRRLIFSKLGTRYGSKELPETLVQDLFREAGISEPKAVTLPAPPPAPPNIDRRNPFHVEMSNALLGLGRGLGFSPEGAVLFRHSVFLGLGLGLPLLIFWLWRRSRR